VLLGGGVSWCECILRPVVVVHCDGFLLFVHLHSDFRGKMAVVKLDCILLLLFVPIALHGLLAPGVVL